MLALQPGFTTLKITTDLGGASFLGVDKVNNVDQLTTPEDTVMRDSTK